MWVWQGTLRVILHSSLMAGETCDLPRPHDSQKAHCGLYHNDFHQATELSLAEAEKETQDDCLKDSIH